MKRRVCRFYRKPVCPFIYPRGYRNENGLNAMYAKMWSMLFDEYAVAIAIDAMNSGGDYYCNKPLSDWLAESDPPPEPPASGLQIDEARDERAIALWAELRRKKIADSVTENPSPPEHPGSDYYCDKSLHEYLAESDPPPEPPV